MSIKAEMRYLTICLILLVAGCGRPAAEIITDNKYLCDPHDGFYGIYATNSALPRLLLCNDGTVKWATKR